MRADRGLEKQGYHEYLEVLHMKLAIIGFVLMIVLLYVLIREKMAPPVAFILLPLIAAACAGFGMEDIAHLQIIRQQIMLMLQMPLGLPVYRNLT